MSLKLQARLPYLILVVVILLLDRWTKSWIVDNFALNEPVPVIDGFFNITYVRNTGIAFGILNTVSSSAKTAVLAALTVLAVVVVVVYSLRNPPGNCLLQTALSLILAGALGNLYDRLNYGFVIDFLEVYVHNYHWPAFNVADSAISIGVVLLAFEMFRHEAPRPA